MNKQSGRRNLSGVDTNEHRAFTQNGGMSNGKQTTTNGHAIANGHECQRPDPAAARRFSYVLAACLTFCTAVTLGVAAVLYYKYNGMVLGVSRRVEIDVGDPGTLWIPPAEQPQVPLSAFPKFSPFGFNAKRNLRHPFLTPTHAEDIVHNGDEVDEVGQVGEGSPVLLFMHVWKCAGSSLRHLLMDWAALENQTIAIVVRCSDVISEGERVCMQDHQLVDEVIQVPRIRESHVIAGHFTWGFQDYIKQPYVMFTTLRNPLELVVSGQQYLWPHETHNLHNAIDHIGKRMSGVLTNRRSRLEARAAVAGSDVKWPVQLKDEDPVAIGFIYRFMEPEVLSTISLDDAVEGTMRRLDTFWLVGVVEQYQGFMAMLQTLMDPLKRHGGLWKTYAVGKNNVSPHGAPMVLGGLDPDLVHQFNQSLAHQWRVYEHAIDLFQHRCREILPTHDHEMCEVPVSPSSYLKYTPTE